MELPEKGSLLRIIIGEESRHKGMPLYEWIVIQARELGIAGATACRGMMGYGKSSRIKTSSILRLSEDLPVIIELVDTREKLIELLNVIDPVLTGGLVTLEDMHIHMYRHTSE